MTFPHIRSIAIINPVGGFGMIAYCFELAEGLASHHVDVDVYTSDVSPLAELPTVRHHGCFPVLGSTLFKQKLTPWKRSHDPCPAMLPHPLAHEPQPVSLRNSRLWRAARRQFLQLELACHLRRKGYDLIWTQWPDIYGSNFWRICKILGMTTAHAVHNVLPHEEQPHHMSLCREIYGQADLLFAHSEWAKNELLRLFPEVHKKVLVAPHGMYTVYPRKPEARQRMRRELYIPDDQAVCLICGAIRPYKNIDSLLLALADERCAQIVLIVAGEESGYTDCCSSDGLARTRRIAQQLGIAERVRLIPRFLQTHELAELFEAADMLTLPYLKHYGSGLLLLGMTFGKYIVATDTGGTREYLARYPRHTLLEGTEVPYVVEGLLRGAEAVALEGDVVAPEIAELQWSAIARNVLTMIENTLHATVSCARNLIC
jgi:D-inositol-3-phosphate glycosyltransferase